MNPYVDQGYRWFDFDAGSDTVVLMVYTEFKGRLLPLVIIADTGLQELQCPLWLEWIKPNGTIRSSKIIELTVFPLLLASRLRGSEVGVCSSGVGITVLQAEEVVVVRPASKEGVIAQRVQIGRTGPATNGFTWKF